MLDAGVSYRNFHSPSQSASLVQNPGCEWVVPDVYEFRGFQGVWSLPPGGMTPSLLEGNMSLITINRAGIQKVTTALTSFKVHTYLVCAQKELSRSEKKIYPGHCISRRWEMPSSGMSCSCLELPGSVSAQLLILV